MLNKVSAAILSCFMRLRSFVAAFKGPQQSDQWDALYADDPRFQDENYEVIFATTRSVF